MPLTTNQLHFMLAQTNLSMNEAADALGVQKRLFRKYFVDPDMNPTGHEKIPYHIIEGLKLLTTHTYNPSPDYLRSILESCDIGTNECARKLNVNTRNFRKHFTDPDKKSYQPITIMLQVSIEALCASDSPITTP